MSFYKGHYFELIKWKELNYPCNVQVFQVSDEKAQHYLEQHLEEVKNDPYALAIVTYVFHLANSTKKEEALRMLESHKKENAGQFFHFTI